nr:MarR family winged helix-turn-helix transcriptional regulator [uncultured Cellulosilyticum sp.]
MLSESLEFLANYLWQQSNAKIYEVLSEDEIKGFSISDYYYLTAIYHLNEPNLGTVASELHLTKPAISALVKRLEHHKLIEKTQSQEDKRIFTLKLTPKGLNMIHSDPKRYQHLEEVITSVISPSEVQALSCLLEVIEKLIKGDLQ